MNKTETELDNARTLFFAHRGKCKECKRFELHNTKTLALMCLQGTLLYKSLLKSEDDIVKQHQAAQRARETKADRRELLKQLQSQK